MLSGTYMHLDDIITFIKVKYQRTATPEELLSQGTTRFVRIDGEPSEVSIEKEEDEGKVTLVIS